LKRSAPDLWRVNGGNGRFNPPKGRGQSGEATLLYGPFFIMFKKKPPQDLDRKNELICLLKDAPELGEVVFSRQAFKRALESFLNRMPNNESMLDLNYGYPYRHKNLLPCQYFIMGVEMGIGWASH